MIMNLLTLTGALGMFLYGMNMMSTGLQKTAGNGLRRLLGTMTSNPFKGVLTGLGVTAAIQSSSATTVMVVGFVSAGLLTLAQAIGVIMGANIGTTMTAWIIAVFGFKADISALAVPLMALGFIFSVSRKGKLKNVSELVIGFSLLFLGLSLMKQSVPDLRETPQVLEFISGWSGHGFISVLLFLALGAVLTLVLQSSSATVALTLIMLDMGWIQSDMAAAMVLGENIGTTITANIAASVGSVNAKRAALAHTVFNVFGVMWVLTIFYPFTHFIQWLVSLMGVDEATSVIYGISMLHTVFNLINTFIMIWFTKQIEKLVTAVIRDSSQPEDATEGRVRYLDYGLVATPELALAESSKEIVHFSKIMKNGLEYVSEAISSSDDPDRFETFRDKLVKYEEISDRIEYEIVKFLNDLGKNHLSEESKGLVRSQIRICGELESLGDSGESISRSLMHMSAYGRRLSAEHIAKLCKMTGFLSQAYEDMIWNLENAGKIRDIHNSEVDEQAINAFRDECRERELEGIESKGDAYFETVFYLNILEQLEKMGDFLINISQSVMRSGLPA
ncbi:MAG: Na/Pi cotransporter family protein [Bacteroidales bacterium]|nr:Na/Pi cotransporter family protein [Candidatus Cryptobacteroides onthequi]